MYEMDDKINELKMIGKYLTENGWEDCGEYISKDYKFIIDVQYDASKKKFLIRSAILPIFDRWANSGAANYFDTYEECIEFLKGKYIIESFKEINFLLEDEIDRDGHIEDNAYNLITKIINLVTDWFEKQ